MKNKYSDFGKQVKIRLIELDQTQEWLISRCKEKTGLYIDSSCLNKILTGRNNSTTIKNAITEILELEHQAECEKYSQKKEGEKMFYDVFLLLCHEQNISPSKAAQEIGFNKASVTNWKNNGYTPREEILNKIATYFDVSVDYLLGRTNEKIPFKTTKKGAKAEMSREMEIEFEGCKFKLVKQKPEVPDEQFVRIDDLTYPALKRYSNESGIPIDELASQMVAFAICHLVIEEYDPQKQKEKRGESR